MLKKAVAYAGAGIVGLGVLFFVANRPISQVFGYLRAGASTTVKSLENEIPDAIHDEKAQAELTASRQQLVDRQVQLNLSQNQLKGLQNEITSLTEAIGGRKQVLGSAYPVLQKALDGGQEQVTFISTKFSLNDFQHEIDDLLAMQDRDENALRIKQQGYDRLAGSVADGEAALTEMKNRLLEIEQEFAVLKTRRDQARMEAVPINGSWSLFTTSVPGAFSPR
jgi:peptidoglycan hydrolase CwlO-like protein